MASDSSFCRELTSNPRRVLALATILLPLVPALVAYLMKSDSWLTLKSSDDKPILAAWTFLQVAVVAYFVYLAASGPPNYLTAYTATMIAYGYFMRDLGEPIGIKLAYWLAVCGIDGRFAPAVACYLHHLLVGGVTWVFAWVVAEMTKESAQPTRTSQEPNEHE